MRLLQKALDYQGVYTLDDVAHAVQTGESVLWPGERSVMVTDFEGPRNEEGRIWLAGGDMTELVSEIRPRAEAFARSNGAQGMNIIGRPGWARVLAKEGYGQVAVVLRKIL